MTTPISLWLRHTGPGPTCAKTADIYLAYNSPNKKDAVIFSMQYGSLGHCFADGETVYVDYPGAMYVFMRNGENHFGFF